MSDLKLAVMPWLHTCLAGGLPSAALATGILFLTAAAVSYASKNRSLALVFFCLGAVFLVASPVVATNGALQLTFVLLAAVPTGTVLNHALLLYFVRRRLLPQDSQVTRDALHQAVGGDHVDEVFEQALSAGARYFSPEVIALRYGPAAITLFVVSLNYATFLCDVKGLGAAAPWVPVKAATLGLAGAYLYVCLQLGRRSFQSDITPGTTLWCVFTVAAGPILAGIADKLLVAPGAPKDPTFGPQVLYFAAGFSPRLVVGILDAAAKRIYLGAGTLAQSARVVPLTSVRGIDSEVEDRLREEGIVDAHTLASSDPIRLLRNTAYDKRTLACWIDNAILLSRLPEHRDALEKLGVRGASDLARYGGQIRFPKGEPPTATLQALADAIHLEPALLTEACLRFWDDAQVRLVWLLYKVEGDGTQSTPDIEDEDLIDTIASLENEAADPERRQEQHTAVAKAAREMPATSASGLSRELDNIATAYERVRATIPSSASRTQEMDRLMARARVLGHALAGSPTEINARFATGTEGNRIVALVLMRDQPSAGSLPTAIEAILRSKSAFEQYNALCVARELKPLLSAEGLAELRAAVRAQMTPDGHIRPSSDRYTIAQEVLSDIPGPPVSSRGAKQASSLPS